MKQRRITLGRTTLQIIAMLAMLCDHVAYIFIDVQKNEMIYQGMRIIGRISFPIFCFVLVQGFLSTQNVKKYLLRILVFAFLSEIPYDAAFSKCLFDWSQQNVLFTMLISLLVLAGVRKYETNLLAEGGIMFAGCLLAALMHTDYSYFGVVLVTTFYLQRRNLRSQILWGMILALIYGSGGIQSCAVLALPLCYWYSDKKEEKRLPRYFFYIFYPAHLLLLWGISCLI